MLQLRNTADYIIDFDHSVRRHNGEILVRLQTDNLESSPTSTETEYD